MADDAAKTAVKAADDAAKTAVKVADDAAKAADDAARRRKAADDAAKVAKGGDDAGRREEGDRRGHKDRREGGRRRGQDRREGDRRRRQDRRKAADDAAKVADDAAKTAAKAANDAAKVAAEGADDAAKTAAKNAARSPTSTAKSAKVADDAAKNAVAADDAVATAVKVADDAAKAADRRQGRQGRRRRRHGGRQGRRRRPGRRQEGREGRRRRGEDRRKADAAAKTAARWPTTPPRPPRRWRPPRRPPPRQPTTPPKSPPKAVAMPRAAANAAAKTADDAAKAAAKAADDAAKTATKAADDAAKAAAKTADTAKNVVAGAADKAAKAAGQSAAAARARLTQLFSGKADDVAKGGTRLAKAMKQVKSSKDAAKMGKAIGKAVRKLATSLQARAGAKIAAKTASMASNPLSWLMAAYDAASMAVDMADPEGYNNFVSNHMIENQRNVIEVNQRDAALQAGYSYPLLFPLEAAFPEVYAAAWEELIEEHVEPSALTFLSDEAVLAMDDAIADAFENDAEVVYPGWMQQELDAALERAMRHEPKARDQLFLEMVRQRLPETHRRYVAAYPSASTGDTFAVSLSEAGVHWWNAQHRADWLAYHDIFDNLAPPPDYVSADVALFTDRYRVIDEGDPGTEMRPNVRERKLAEKMAIAMPIGHLVSYCEKVKNIGTMGSDIKDENTAVDPYQYGVRFNVATGVCTYTEAYCLRMGGLEYRGPDHRISKPDRPKHCPEGGLPAKKGESSLTKEEEIECAGYERDLELYKRLKDRSSGAYITDCYLPPSQEAAQFVAGTTVTNGMVRALKGDLKRIQFKTGKERRAQAITGQCETGEMCRRDHHCAAGQRCLPQEETGALACTADQCVVGGFWREGTRYAECEDASQTCQPDADGVKACR